ncbi:MAG TPA: DUF6263 family protein [Dinghuibacter sp.]|uniref:DUF6263 family protein n=1 Tax=Dinghuibacter sp. TaxID=2024697 RepID=UPI002C78ECD4|nr:DUF6263 family protein [Dinghuibacter sp.]HTJ14497.1 DUF6263 family protein [Dinghuibacter sp.]
MKAEWSILVFGAGMVLWSCTPDARLTMYFNPQPGAVYHYLVSERTRSMSTEGGAKVFREHNVALSYHSEAKQNGLQISIDGLDTHTQAANGKETNRSEKAPPLDCRLDPQGRVMDLAGLPRQDQEYVGHLLEKSWRIFPNHPVAIGDSWTGLDTLNADPHIPITTRFTLTKRRAGILYIQTESDVDLIRVDLRGESHPGNLTLKGRQHGMLHVDERTGMVLDGQTLLKAEGVLEAGGKSVRMRIDSTCDIQGA